jgi:EAL domain-containing protein (putative c-di-GMP-specific phosphodiesterase class I)
MTTIIIILPQSDPEIAALRHPSGDLLGGSPISLDITTRKESDARCRGLLEAAPDAMVVVNQDGKIVLLNVQAEKEFGYRRDELVGQKITNIIPQGFAERLIADALRSVEEALPQQIGTGIEACAQARAWVDAGLPVMTMAVNVSAKQFENENFMRDIFAILDETGLDPRCLELELTESVLMRRAELTTSTLLTLREKGIQVAVDDFGTGYSSLSYLRKFPLDALKIDRSFVSQITTIPDEMTIVRAIISMGRSLNLRVIAEGVETHDQLDFLKLHQCDEAQGYYFSPPLPPQEFARLLESPLPSSNPCQRVVTH